MLALSLAHIMLLQVPTRTDANTFQQAEAAYREALSGRSTVQWQNAIDVIRACLAAQRTTPQQKAHATMWQAESLLQMDRLAEAATAYRDYVQDFIDFDRRYESLALVRLGHIQLQNGDYQAAIETLQPFRQRLSTDPHAQYAFLTLGESELAGDNSEAALDYYEQAAAKATDAMVRDEARLGAARARELLQQTERAVEEYRTLMDAEASTVRDLAGYYLGRLLLRHGNENEALELVERLKSRRPAGELRHSIRQLEQEAILVAAKSALRSKRFARAIALLRRLGDQPESRQERDYLTGMSLVGLRDYEAALQTLSRIEVSRLDKGQRHHVNSLCAWCLFELHRYSEAIVAIERCLENGPAASEAQRLRLRLVVAYVETKRIPDALAVFLAMVPAEGALSAREQLETALFLASRAEQQELTSAAREVYQILARDGTLAEFRQKALEGLSRISESQQDLANDGEAFDKLIRDEPSAPGISRTILLRAQALAKAGEDVQALEAFQLIIRDHADSGEYGRAVLAAGKLLQNMGPSESAVKLLSEFLTAKRFDKCPAGSETLARFLLAWNLEQLGRQHEAVQQYAQIINATDAGEVWPQAALRYAGLLASSGDSRGADDLLQRVLRTPSTGQVHESALYLAGQLAADARDWSLAESRMRQLRDAASKDRTRFVAGYWVAESLFQQFEFAESLSMLQDLEEQLELDRSVGREESWLGMIPLRRAQCLAQLKRWGEAAKAARSVSQRFPQFRQAFEADYLIGRCHAQKGQFRQAREFYERVIQSPDGAHTETAAMAQWMIGETFFHQNRLDQAIMAYTATETSYAFPRWQAAAALQLGTVHELLKDFQSAIEAYARVVHKYPKSPYTDRAVSRISTARAQLLATKKL